VSAVVYLGAGNSDNKLSQHGWVHFVGRIRWHIKTFLEMSKTRAYREDGPPAVLLGEWFSAPDVPYQNACWAVAVPDDVEPTQILAFQEVLAACAANHQQDTISWAHAPTTLLLGPKGDPDAAANADLATRPE
jgi:hypothetical protein